MAVACPTVKGSQELRGGPVVAIATVGGLERVAPGSEGRGGAGIGHRASQVQRDWSVVAAPPLEHEALSKKE